MSSVAESQPLGYGVTTPSAAPRPSRMFSLPRFRAAQTDPPWPLFLAVSVAWTLASPFVSGLFDGTEELTHFRDRAIGMTTLQGVDASGYAGNYVVMTSSLAVLFLLAFFLFTALDRALKKRIDADAVAKELQGIQRLSEIAIVLLAMRLVFRDDFLATLTTVVYFVIALAFVVILAKIHLHRRQGPESFGARLLDDSRIVVALLFLPLPLPFVFWTVFDLPIGFDGLPTAAWLVAWAAAAGAAFLAWYGLLRRRGIECSADADRLGSRLVLAAVPVYAFPISIPLSNELQYVLSRSSARTVGLGTMALLAAASVVLFLAHRRGLVRAGTPALVDFVLFPLFVATAALYKVHRQTIDLGFLDYFHTGEFTVPTQQFFDFSSVPLIDLRLAHTLSDFFYPALQSALAGYRGMDMLIWRSWLPAVVTVVILYFFLARLVSPAFALLATSFAPVMGTVTSYYSFALLPPLFLAGALRRPTLPRYVLVWASAVGLTLWRFDFGMVGWVALFLVLGVHLARHPGRLKVIAASLAIVAAASAAGFLLVALASHRPALESLLFLLKTYTFRLATRTRAELFDEYSTAAVVQYYLLPAVSLVTILYFAARRLLFSKYVSPGKHMLVFLAIFSLVISLRSLERHSLIEDFNPYLFVFLLAALPFLFRGTGAGRESPAARMAFFGVLVLNAFFWLPPSSYARSDLAHVFERGTWFERRDWTEDSQRVFFDTERHRDVVRFLRDHLDGGETFFDFTNSPLLYVFAGKEFPTRVIPNIIQTSETVQADVIKDLAELHAGGRLPFVIFKQGNEYWDNVDEVPNEVRSYRIAEFIYRHYAPLATVGRYQVWVESSYEDRDALTERYASRYEPPLSPEPVTKDMTRTSGGDPAHATFRVGTADPQVSSLYRLDEVPPLGAAPHWYLELSLRSSPPGGRLQVFFRIDDEDFAEAASVWAEIPPAAGDGFSALRLPVPAGPSASRLVDLRFDPPPGSETTFAGAALVGSEIAAMPLSPDELSQNFRLLDLPYVWGTHDPLAAASRTEVVDVLLDRPTFLDSGGELELPFSSPSPPGAPRTASGNGADKAGYLHLRMRPADPRFEESETRVRVEYGEPIRSSFELRVRDARSSYELYPVPFAGDFETHDAGSFAVGERTVFEAAGDDPYLHQVLDLGSLPVLDREHELFVVLDYRSSAAGELETFFGFDSSWFRPEDSVVVDIEKTSNHGEPGRVVAPVPAAGLRLTDLRFDFPRESLFEVVRVEFARRTGDDADYLVRLGTQWAWWSQEVGEIELRTSGPLTVSAAYLRAGD